MIIYAGGNIHHSIVGDLHLDQQVDQTTIDAVAKEMLRRGLEPNDIRWARVDGSDIDFGLREPLQA